MKRITIKTFAFTFLAAGMLAGCSTENTTGVETENTGTTTESQPNMGGRTGDSAELDSVPAEGTDNNTTNQNNGNGTDHSTHDHGGTGNN